MGHDQFEVSRTELGDQAQDLSQSGLFERCG